MIYKLSFIILCALILINCKTETPPSVEAEKEEVRQFFKEWVGFINSRSLEKFDEFWVENPDASLIVPEKREAIISYNNIKQYYSEKIAEFDSLEYNLWDPTIWVSPTKSEAQVNFMAKRKIIFKNGFIIEFDPVRSSALLLKFGGKWKVLNLHESTQAK
ncbi:MAG: nuclear transport factor 2 family protein [Bacteroidetes bacterium]|nr:nuclear transport factor 2 family protein [Bacteroidota bacterium]